MIIYTLYYRNIIIYYFKYKGKTSLIGKASICGVD